jgi:putative intracellular protease/amidase
MANILMVVSAADSLTMKDGSEHPTGYWAEELVVSHQTLRDAGHTVHIATPGGAKPTVDQVSLAPESAGGKERADSFRDYLARIDAELSAPLVLADVDIAGYDAVVMPGGHGPMTDLYKDADLGRLLVAADGAGKIIAPFCHGPAGLLSATLDDGSFAFAGRRLTVFTNDEELNGGTGENTPWLVEDALKDKGAVIENAASWSSNVVRDRNLITGQNPQSSEDVAKEVVSALGCSFDCLAGASCARRTGPGLMAGPLPLRRTPLGAVPLSVSVLRCAVCTGVPRGRNPPGQHLERWRRSAFGRLPAWR